MAILKTNKRDFNANEQMSLQNETLLYFTALCHPEMALLPDSRRASAKPLVNAYPVMAKIAMVAEPKMFDQELSELLLSLLLSFLVDS